MTHVTRDKRLVEIPTEHREYAQVVIERIGIIRACELIGVSRVALLGVIARGEGMPGTAAIFERAYSRRQAA
jgi:hypothetical protein